MDHIFVDESGDTGLRSRRHLVFGFVYCTNPNLLHNVLRYTFETIRTYLTYKLVLKRSLINKTSNSSVS